MTGPRLTVVSHPAVLPVNQLVYAELSERGWSVDVVVPARWGHEYGAVRPQPLPALEHRFHPVGVAFAGRPQRHFYRARVQRLLRHLRPEVLFLEQEAFSVSALQWAAAAVRAGVPFGVQADENLDRDLPITVRAWRRWVLRHAAFVAARSPTASDLVRGWGATGEVRLVPHHVPSWSLPSRVKGDRFRVGYAGRLVPEKGLDVLVDAVRRLGETAELVVAGDGPLRDWLAGQDLGGARLRLLTDRSHDSMDQVYADIDVLVLPSRSTARWVEQFGRVLVEALWCGAAVIGSDSGEIPWVVTTTGGGLIVAEGDAAALAAALEDLRDDEGRRAAYAAEGGRRAREMFSVGAVATALEEVLGSARRRVAHRDERGPQGARRPVVALVAHGIHDRGGMERASAELIRHSHDRYRFVVVACELAPDLLPLVDRWVRIRVPMRPIPLKFACFYVSAGVALRRLPADLVHTVGAIVPNRADVAGIHFCHAGYRAACGRLAPAGSPLLRRLNTTAARALALAAERWSYRQRRTGYLAAVSQGVATEVARHYPGCGVGVVPNGVDPARHRPDDGARRTLRHALGVPDARFVVLFVGGDWHRKGLAVAIEAVAEVERSGVDIELWVVGAGDQRRFAGLASELGCAGSIRFLGPVSEVQTHYQAADVFVLPSEYETFSIVCFEAAASGLPLVITPVHGAAELVEMGGGVLVERSAGSVADALRELAASVDRRAHLGGRARAAAAGYTWDRSATMMTEIFQQLESGLVDGPPPKPSPRLRAATLLQEVQRSVQAAAGWRSKLVLAPLPIVGRALRRAPSAAGRGLPLRASIGSIDLSFRLNAGDIQAIREVLLDSAYRLPFDMRPRSLVDLGANIGLTSAYYAARYDLDCVVAVEPDPSNAQLARRNLAPFPAKVIQAAASANGGTTAFRTSGESNLGRLDPDGELQVEALTMDQILDQVPGGRTDLLKIDIEGGEAQLFTGDCSWLGRVDAIIIELHPPVVDTQAVVDAITAAGFEYVPAGSRWPESMDSFVRRGLLAPPEPAGSRS